MQRRCKLWTFVWLAASNLGVGAVVRAEAGTSPKGDESAVRAASKEFLSAARRGDEKALQKMWTPDGDFVDSSGRVLKAAELIHQLAASTPHDSVPATESVSETALRFITPDTAIEDGIADRLVGPDGNILTRRFTAVWAKRDSRWLLDSLREGPADSSPLNEHLKSLEWLLGEWAATTDDTAILVSSHWCDGGKYILREFIVSHDGGETISGTQRIGWDPISSQIKSWTFDSEGGSGEGRWHRDGNRWLVDTIDITDDGKTAKTSSAYIPGDDRHFTWEVAGGDVAGAKLKPLRVEFRRAAEDE